MKKISKRLKFITVTSLLSALGILAALAFPKIVLGPASYTLGAHLPIFISVFISPLCALIVSILTTVGFFFALPVPVVVRAFSHILWAVPMAYAFKLPYFKLGRAYRKWSLAVAVGFLHSILETLAIILMAIFLPGLEIVLSAFWAEVLIGFGFFVHSLVDFALAMIVVTSLKRITKFKYIFN